MTTRLKELQEKYGTEVNLPLDLTPFKWTVTGSMYGYTSTRWELSLAGAGGYLFAPRPEYEQEYSAYAPDRFDEYLAERNHRV